MFFNGNFDFYPFVLLELPVDFQICHDCQLTGEVASWWAHSSDMRYLKQQVHVLSLKLTGCKQREGRKE